MIRYRSANGMFFGVVLLVCAALYPFYWAAKTVSYEIFYKDMVQDTVREMVKPECLKDRYTGE